MKKHIAVLMTVFNRKDKTLRCLDCLYANKMPEEYSFDVYLTDDGCTDGTPDAVREKYPNVNIIQGDGNLFWARGMRVAWNEAAKHDYDYYLWLNDDTYIYQDALSNIIKAAEVTNGKAVLAGATKSAVTSECTYGLIVNEKKLVPNGSLQEGYGLNGNFVLISREVFRQLGNMDKHYHHAGGDTHYGLLAKKKGVPVYLIGEYIGTCEGHEKLDKWTDPEVPFRERWKNLNRPNGMPLNILFYQQKTFYGLPTAIFHTFTTLFRCCFPKAFMFLKGKKQ